MCTEKRKEKEKMKVKDLYIDKCDEAMEMSCNHPDIHYFVMVKDNIKLVCASEMIYDDWVTLGYKSIAEFFGGKKIWESFGG